MTDLPCTLAHEDIRLRRVHPSHVDDVFHAVEQSQRELATWFGWAGPHYDRDAAATFVAEAWIEWNQRRAFHFVITRDGEPGVLGVCGLDELSPVRKTANLGYWVRSDQTGRGLATHAARLVSGFGFDHAGLQRIELFHAAGNDASGRVALKVGFTFEGVRQQHLELHGRRVDAVSYGLVEPLHLLDG